MRCSRCGGNILELDGDRKCLQCSRPADALESEKEANMGQTLDKTEIDRIVEERKQRIRDILLQNIKKGQEHAAFRKKHEAEILADSATMTKAALCDKWGIPRGSITGFLKRARKRQGQVPAEDLVQPQDKSPEDKDPAPASPRSKPETASTAATWPMLLKFSGLAMIGMGTVLEMNDKLSNVHTPEEALHVFTGKMAAK